MEKVYYTLLYVWYNSRPGNEDQKIWLNALSCGPGTSCLTACQQCPVSEDFICQHYQDVSIICSKRIMFIIFYQYIISITVWVYAL